MIFGFHHVGAPGTVSVTVEPVTDTDAMGKPERARGFPCCTAVVEHPARGYHALCGWVQLVRSSDNSSAGDAFEMDPFVLFEDAPSPYAFFGIRPVLFDAPSREERMPLAWLAHSFLAWTPLEPDERHVVPLLGFSWGFDVDTAKQITIRQPAPLNPADWASHCKLLGEEYPAWRFDPWTPSETRG